MGLEVGKRAPIWWCLMLAITESEAIRLAGRNAGFWS